MEISSVVGNFNVKVRLDGANPDLRECCGASRQVSQSFERVSKEFDARVRFAPFKRTFKLIRFKLLITHIF